jgi:hypothetical protein
MTELAEKITALRNEGKSYREIENFLGCSKGTISYHLSEGQKEKTLNRTRKKRANPKNTLSIKLENFFESKRRKGLRDRINKFQKKGDGFDENTKFTLEEAINKIGDNPVCYLSGKSINLDDKKAYSLDHKIPVCKEGDNSLDNLGLCDYDINNMKSYLTLDEFLENCKLVLEHNGYVVSKK